jgi:hypothetical protein
MPEYGFRIIGDEEKAALCNSGCFVIIALERLPGFLACLTDASDRPAPACVTHECDLQEAESNLAIH